MSAQLTLTENRTIVGSMPFALCRVTRAWGEGTSNSGMEGGTGTIATTNDATWSAGKYNVQNWTNPGGDFIATPSATANVGSGAAYNWSSDTMVADVESWRPVPANNFGWILIGMKNGQLVGANGTETSAKRFASREFATVADRPELTVGYAASIPATVRETG